jgi:hypothetical protein
MHTALFALGGLMTGVGIGSRAFTWFVWGATVLGAGIITTGVSGGWGLAAVLFLAGVVIGQLRRASRRTLPRASGGSYDPTGSSWSDSSSSASSSFDGFGGGESGGGGASADWGGESGGDSGGGDSGGGDSGGDSGGGDSSGGSSD